MQKSPSPANANRFSINSQGVKRSDKLITQKSWPIGAPKTDDPLKTALIPGRISISTSG